MRRYFLLLAVNGNSRSIASFCGSVQAEKKTLWVGEGHLPVRSVFDGMCGVANEPSSDKNFRRAPPFRDLRTGEPSNFIRGGASSGCLKVCGTGYGEAGGEQKLTVLERIASTHDHEDDSTLAKRLQGMQVTDSTRR
jgi:hypothetical protein